MVKLLLFLFLSYILYIIVKPILKVWRTMHKMKQGDFSGLGDIFGQPGAQKGSSAYDDDGQRKAGWTKARFKKKKIAKDVGEYVKFSEVTVAAKNTRKDSYSSSNAYPAEPQVTDVEWEDIR